MQLQTFSLAFDALSVDYMEVLLDCQSPGTWNASGGSWREADLSRRERRKSQAQSHSARGSAADGTRPLCQQAADGDAAEE